MKSSAYLVNTSRAGLVDTAALLAELDRGGIAGAGLDVFDEEPLPGDHPLRTHPDVLATPHLGYVTAANYRTYFTEAVEDIARLAGRRAGPRDLARAAGTVDPIWHRWPGTPYCSP